MSAFARTVFLVGTSTVLLLGKNTVHADEGNECRVVEVDFLPSDNLQIVAWVEDAAGNFVQTIYVTQSVGTYGLGNRPGILDFNSGPAWPYGRREQTFPVWAHRHGLTFPRVEFQNGDDRNLSHPFDDSSQDTRYCRPIDPTEPSWDTGTCASPAVFTDKGRANAGMVSLYPPRADIDYNDSVDDPSAMMFAELNPLDIVSQATPMGGVPSKITWPIAPDLPTGSYVMFVEVAKEFDMNATYNETSYPAPNDIPWASFGAPYRGQPSVVYQTAFEIGEAAGATSTSAYVGYGDPNGQDGMLRTADASINVDVPGSGGARLTLVADDSGMYRVKVTSRYEVDAAAPGEASELATIDVSDRSAELTFVAPGEDGALGTVTGYEIRYRAGEPITDDNFASSSPISGTVTPDEPGQVQSVTITGLLPLTTYYVGIRAFDDCRNFGPLATMLLETEERPLGEVDACFVATAAYGSLLANDVEMLRHFRDSILQTTVLGELMTEVYYTFGPSAAGVIAESELLREASREALRPLIERVSSMSVTE